MRQVLVLGLLVAACSNDPPPAAPASVPASTASTAAPRLTLPSTTASTTVTPPPTASATSPAPTASAQPPRAAEGVSLQEQTSGDEVDQWKLTVAGLPAVSEDGQRIAYVINEQDGMRGYPNHKLFIKVVAKDTVEKSFPVFNADQLDKATRAKKIDDERKKVTANATAARAALAAGKWLPMTPATGARGKAWAAGDLSFELSPALRFTATSKPDSKKLLELDARKWKQKDMVAGPSVCSFSPALDAVHVSLDRKIVAATVVHLVTSGGDSCNLSDELHTLTWK